MAVAVQTARRSALVLALALTAPLPTSSAFAQSYPSRPIRFIVPLGFDINTWTAILVPAKTPAGPTARLNTEVVRILGLPDVQEKLRVEGGEVSPMTLDESAKFFRAEVAAWKQMLKDSNIPID